MSRVSFSTGLLSPPSPMGSGSSKPTPAQAEQSNQHTTQVTLDANDRRPVSTIGTTNNDPCKLATLKLEHNKPLTGIHTSYSPKALPELQISTNPYATTDSSRVSRPIVPKATHRPLVFNNQTRPRNDQRPPMARDLAHLPLISTENKRRTLPESDQVCKFFRQGNCRLGTSCRYRHTAPGSSPIVTDSRQPSESLPVSFNPTTDHTPPAALKSLQMPKGIDGLEPTVTFQHPESAKRQNSKRQPRKKPPHQPNMGSSASKGKNQSSDQGPETLPHKSPPSVPYLDISDTNLDSTSPSSFNRRIQPQNLPHVKGKVPAHLNSRRESLPMGFGRRFVQDAEVREAEQARSAKMAEEEATKTVDHIVFSSTKVTFGSGASVLHVLTGVESCRVVVKNLPAKATKAQVISLFTQPGFDETQFAVVALHKTHNGSRQEAVVIFNDVVVGKNAVIGLDNIEFGNEKLKLEMTSKQGQMNASNRDPNVLSVSWQAPSTSVIATYSSMQEAKEKVNRLDRRLCGGRMVHVALNKKPEKLPAIYFNPASVIIRGLPVDSALEAIQEFSGTSRIKHLTPRRYDLEDSLKRLEAFIKNVGGNDAITIFEPQSTITEHGMVSAKVHFFSWSTAKQVQASLENKAMDFFGGAKCYALLPDPFQYFTSIPFQQFKAQESMLRSLADHSQSDKTTGTRIRITGGQAGKFARVEVSGPDKRAVGSLKVRVEQLVAGESLEHWDRFFSVKEGELFLASVFDATNTLIRCDKRLNVLKAFGEPEAVKKAKFMIKEQVDKLASLEYTFFLKRASIRFFVQRGAAVLKEQLGEDNVMLDVSSSPCKITVRGGEAAKHMLSKLVDESLAPTNHSGSITEEVKCPICFDDIESPFRLACGHFYCNGCLRHFLTTACDTKLFPLTCMGEDGTCGKHITVPTIQRFLLPAQVNHLLEMSFQDYLARHPQEFKYCPTPDCPQIYRVEEGKGVVHCPSCLASRCLSCHREDHEGFTCEEWKLHCDPEAQERLLMGWAKDNGNVKKCPNCGALIEKNGGCNHMECSQCKSHICWKCMGIFENVYEHLGLVHEGPYDDGYNGYWM